jgi:hypothetical protein
VIGIGLSVRALLAKILQVLQGNSANHTTQHVLHVSSNTNNAGNAGVFAANAKMLWRSKLTNKVVKAGDGAFKKNPLRGLI